MTGPESTVDAELEAMVEIVRVAAARAKELYDEHLRSGFAVEEKAPGDPVTRADREIDACIGDELRLRFPAAGLVGEESVPDASGLRDALARQAVFFVDPIDGTREFIRGNGEFAVMIGLACGGRAVAGAIAVPAEGLILAGRVGKGAFVQGADGRRRSVRVSDVGRFEDARLLVSRSHRPAIVEPLQRRLGIGRVVPCGSVGVKIARLLLGDADLYVHAGHGLSVWDTCAAEAALGAAGGWLSDLDGRPIDYRGPTALHRGLVASNGLLRDGVLAAIAPAERVAGEPAPKG